jgi:outer membrane receptor protein involved in Fe transport
MRNNRTKYFTIIRGALAFLVCTIWCSLYASADTTFIVTVRDESGQPVSGARVQIDAGPAKSSDSHGSVRFALAQPGEHTVRIVAHGYRSLTETLRSDNQNSINVVLVASAGALRLIGSATGHARTPFNATPVSQKIYPREAYRDQGQPDVTSVLNQTPGALALTTLNTNLGIPIAPAFASVRNALPWETPVLIDGEPIVTPSGTLDLSLLPTYVLQEVELIKGPGDVADAGGGVGGAVNFRTADPTLGSRGTYEVEGDSRGGSFSDLAYDGTLPNGELGYATMLSVDGSPCCSGDPEDYWRKAVLVKIRDIPQNGGLAITSTVMDVTLDRSPGAVYGGLGANAEGYEHLGFGDLALSLDRGGDAYSLRFFTAQTDQGIDTPELSSTYGPDDEAGATLSWTHAIAGLSFVTSARTLQNGISGTNLSEARSSASEAITYKPNTRNEFDLSGSLDEDRTLGRTFDGPEARLGYAYSLTNALALRASYGTSSVAPPLLAASTVDAIERATGADAGIEWRLHGNTTTLSADIYRNSTQNAYALFDDGWVNGPPMVESGAELTLQQFKRVGLGFIAALQVPRTYVWGNTGAYTYPVTNIGYGTFLPFRIPYAQGYSEISYKWPHGSRASIGVLYVGSNNAYGAPAFVTLNSNLELSLGSKAKLQFSVQNLTNALANRLPVFGLPDPQYGLQPFTLRFMFRQSFGAGGLYEH